MNHRTRLKRQAATMYRRHSKHYLSADRSRAWYRAIASLHAYHAASQALTVSATNAAAAGQRLVEQMRLIQLYSLPDQHNLSHLVSNAMNAFVRERMGPGYAGPRRTPAMHTPATPGT